MREKSQAIKDNDQLKAICEPPWIQELLMSFGPEVWIGPQHDEYPVSKWTNPFPVNIYGLEGSLESYEEYIRSRPDLMAEIPLLRGKELGCCCEDAERPDHGSCHATVLINLYLEYAYEKLKEDPKFFTRRR